MEFYWIVIGFLLGNLWCLYFFTYPFMKSADQYIKQLKKQIEELK